MVKTRAKQVLARISSTLAYQFGLLRIRVLAVALSANMQPQVIDLLGVFSFLPCSVCHLVCHGMLA